VAGEVVLVQAVHDQHDRTRALVVEAAVKRMVEPFVRRPALGLGQRLLGLQRVVDDDQIGAAPCHLHLRPPWIAPVQLFGADGRPASGAELAT
jgi:hypothetical protein